MDNRSIARRLLDQADLLAAEPGNLFRSRAYRIAAETVLSMDEPVDDLFSRRGRKGLELLPGIGRHISQAIEAMVTHSN